MASNNFSISSITPVTQNNNRSENISYDVDPAGKTKIIVVTKTNVVSGNGSPRVATGGDKYNVKIYRGHHKLSRLILA